MQDGHLMSRYDLRGVHVLLVEDHADSRELMRTALEYCGAFVTTPTSVERAKGLLHAVRPDIIVTDITMPDDGLGLMREVMATIHQLGIRVPAIAVTAFHGRRQDLLAEGFAEVIEKPLDPVGLCRHVHRHVLRAQGMPIS
jgi:CheY-like chemotaxis protein